MEAPLINKEYQDLLSDRSHLFNLERFKKRDSFRHGISWHVPTQSLIDLLLRFCPIVSVGSGFGYTESLVLKEGGDIISTDLTPDSGNQWCRDGEFFMDVEKLDAVAAVQKYQDRNVFMAWPPYDEPMAFDVTEAMAVGKILVYVGESVGGCNGDPSFFDNLHEKFQLVPSDATVPSWSGIYDDVYVYKKIKE